MKKTILVMTIISIVLLLPGCSFYNYSGWERLDLENVGSIKIPGEWSCYSDGEKIYITDQSKAPMLIQTHSYAGSEAESNDYCKSFKSLKIIESAVLSNSAEYGKVLVEMNGSQTERYFLDIGIGDDIMSFVVWDENIEKSLLLQIAESYSPAETN